MRVTYSADWFLEPHHVQNEDGRRDEEQLHEGVVDGHEVHEQVGVSHQKHDQVDLLGLA